MRPHSCLLLLAAATLARGDAADDLVRARMEKAQIPGLALAVVHKGRLVKSQGYGLAGVELNAPATDRTVFEIGSITKQFTATAILMLVEEGKIALDDPVSKHLPRLPAAWKGVTIKQLLNHTSGIRSYTGATDFIKLARAEHTRAEILRLVEQAPLDFAPGTSWSYNNTGYFLLGMVIEEITGGNYGEFLAERIFKPLGMSQTRPNSPPSIIPGRADGYARTFGSLGNRDPLTTSSAFSAGCLVSTVGDMAKWDGALREGKLLKSATFEEMYTPTKLAGGSTRPYGYGWGVVRKRGKRIYSHGGGTPGFSTLITRHVDDDLTVIVLTNLAGAEAAAGAIAEGVARIYVPVPTLADRTPLADADPDMTERHRAILGRILAAKAEPGELDPVFADLLKRPTTRAVVRSVNAEGPLAAFDPLERAAADGQVKSAYRGKFGETLYLVTITEGEARLVDGLLVEKDE